MTTTLKLKRYLTDKEGEALKGKFLTDKDFDMVILGDTDGYSMEGELLFRYRTNVIPYPVLKAGVDAFRDSVELTEGRGTAAGGSFKRIRKDGSVANTTVSNFVESGNVGFMDPSAMVRYCRKTAFARDHFDKFRAGIPFVEAVDQLYEQLCPTHYARQLAIAKGTNRNYVIGNTSFTTVTVNRNFQTAVHKDSGDLREGFGNLIIHRVGNYTGAYFTLPEFRVAINVRNTDILFVDVHRWHGNTPFVNMTDDCERIAFVMYYRENMISCKQPAQELKDTQMEQGGFLKL